MASDINDLPSTVKDLEATENLLKNYNFTIEKFVNKDATRAALDEYFLELRKCLLNRKKAIPKDKKVVIYAYFSGHGHWKEDS